MNSEYFVLKGYIMGGGGIYLVYSPETQYIPEAVYPQYILVEGEYTRDIPPPPIV